MATVSTSTVKYTDYIHLGNAIAEAFELLRADWVRLRHQGPAPGTLAAYVEVHGPQALPDEVAETLGRAPAYIRDRARTRAQALIVGASRDRGRDLSADRSKALVLSPQTARRYARLIIDGSPEQDGNAQRRKLSPAEVRFIRREYQPGRGSPTSTCALALLFGVSAGVVYQVVQGRTYRDVPDNVPPEEEA